MSKGEKESRVPKLRFKGFADDWMQEKGDNIFNKRSENTNNNESFLLDIGLENLVSNTGVLIGDTSLRTNSNSIFRKGDTLFGRLRPYLNKWWYATEDGLKSGEIWAMYATNKTSSLFLYYLIQTERFLYYANISSGTRMPRASWENIQKQEFNIPSIDEQKLIAKLLYQIEKMITLEQEKLEAILETKHAMLRRVFSTKTSDTMVSFKLSNFISKKGKVNKENKKYTVSSVNNKKGFINQNEQFESTRLNSLDKSTYRIVNPKDFAYNPSRINVGSIGYNDTNDTLIISPLYIVFRINDEIDNRYFYYYTQTEKFLYEVNRNTEGSVRQSLSFENMGNINIPLPKSYKTQLLICQYFNKMENIANNIEQKINSYKNIKAYLLRNLFV